jgi:seryl-tRNA(Sec) selenium transferase
VAAGVDVVCFSGDKLLGGPQAGIIVGRADLLARVRTHPLMRALRVDKLTYAALEATLVEHLAGRATETIPAIRMATAPVEAIAVSAETLAATLLRQGLRAEVIDGVSTIGGGSAAGSELPTRLVALSVDGLSADALASRGSRTTASSSTCGQSSRPRMKHSGTRWPESSPLCSAAFRPPCVFTAAQ